MAPAGVTAAVPRIKRVVLPLDGSAVSEEALPHAVAVAKALDVGITLIRTISPMSYGDAFADYVPAIYDDVTSEVESDVSDYLAFHAGRIQGLGIEDVVQVSASGYPAAAILDEVGDDGEKLVVMGTHGRSGVGRWLLGSVADRVVRHSQGPVLIIRPTGES